MCLHLQLLLYYRVEVLRALPNKNKKVKGAIEPRAMKLCGILWEKKYIKLSSMRRKCL